MSVVNALHSLSVCMRNQSLTHTDSLGNTRDYMHVSITKKNRPNSPGSMEKVELTIAGLLFHRKNERYSTFLTLRLIYYHCVLKN
jgi:hypothetical protein